MPNPTYVYGTDGVTVYQLVYDQAAASLSVIAAPGAVVPPNTPANSITVKVSDLISDALKEINKLAAGEPLPIEESADVKRKLQRLIDRWNARRPLIYNVNFSTFPMIPNHAPHTIGPGANFDVSQRPVEILTASVVLTVGGTSVDVPIDVRGDAWWARQAVKNQTSTFPTDVYYSPDWPNGSLYFWPVPTQANQIRLQMRTVLAQVTAYNQSFSMPPGYWDLLVRELAIDIAPMYGVPVSADMREGWQRALKAVTSNNIASPRGSTADAGMPGVNTRGGFSYVSGK
jgi:hypothetical protein